MSMLQRYKSVKDNCLVLRTKLFLSKTIFPSSFCWYYLYPMFQSISCFNCQVCCCNRALPRFNFVTTNKTKNVLVPGTYNSVKSRTTLLLKSQHSRKRTETHCSCKSVTHYFFMLTFFLTLPHQPLGTLLGYKYRSTFFRLI